MFSLLLKDLISDFYLFSRYHSNQTLTQFQFPIWSDLLVGGGIYYVTVFFFFFGIAFTALWDASWQNQQNDCAPSKASGKPGHPPSLIRVFTVHMKKAWVLSYPLSTSEDSDQTEWMPRLIWVFAGCTDRFVGFVMRWLISRFLSFRAKENN